MKDVLVTRLEPTVFIHSIDVQGRVDGDENVVVAARAAGTITKINVQTGTHVSAGQVMAEIENDAVRSQISELRSSYDLVKQLYEKQKSLWDQKIGTEVQYLQAKNNKESLEQKMKQLNEMLEMYYIKAPFAGTVDELMLKAGQTIAPGMPAIRVVNISQLKVKADLAEAYSSRVKTGNKVNLIFPDINKTATSQVTYTGKVINPSTRTFTVEIGLPSSEDYRPNMVAQVQIIDYSSENSMVVPVNTVQNIDGKDYVYVAGEEKGRKVAHRKEVKVGSIYNGKAEVVSGLNAGDLLITTGYNNLNEGELLRF
jgi:RND family efflux transporter MFP subunit